jgi:hypothetical protein
MDRDSMAVAKQLCLRDSAVMACNTDILQGAALMTNFARASLTSNTPANGLLEKLAAPFHHCQAALNSQAVGRAQAIHLARQRCKAEQLHAQTIALERAKAKALADAKTKHVAVEHEKKLRLLSRMAGQISKIDVVAEEVSRLSGAVAELAKSRASHQQLEDAKDKLARKATARFEKKAQTKALAASAARAESRRPWRSTAAAQAPTDR